MKRTSQFACSAGAVLVAFGAAVMAEVPGTASGPATTAASKPAKSPLVGEKVPSEDPLIKDFHSLGLVGGRVNLFRSASPTRDLVKGPTAATNPDPATLQKDADARMAHLAASGIKVIVSLENPESTEEGDAAAKSQQTLWMNLERQAAEKAGIRLVRHPLINAGTGSMETMTDREVIALIDPIAAELTALSQEGGVMFHCSAGHDRTGMIAAYIRMKYQKWPVEQAIDEMRRLGHNWVKYSANGGVSSWHEEHLKGIEGILSKTGQ